MSVLCTFCVSSSAFSVYEISHASVSASLPRDRFFFARFFSLRGFLSRYCPQCLSEPHRASTCSIILHPRLEVFRAFNLGEVIFSYSFVFQYQGLSADR